MLGAAVVVVVLFIVLNGGSGGTSTTTPPVVVNGNGKLPESAPTLIYKSGQVQGGEQTLSYTHGDTIQIRVESDIATDAHLHGYNVELPVAPGKPAEFNVPATLEGVFDLELHLTNGEVSLATVTVNPA